MRSHVITRGRAPETVTPKTSGSSMLPPPKPVRVCRLWMPQRYLTDVARPFMLIDSPATKTLDHSSAQKNLESNFWPPYVHIVLFPVFRNLCQKFNQTTLIVVLVSQQDSLQPSSQIWRLTLSLESTVTARSLTLILRNHIEKIFDNMKSRLDLSQTNPSLVLLDQP